MSYASIIDSGAKMEMNPFKSGVDSNKCALSYSPSSFAGGKTTKKTKKPKATKKPKK